MSHLRDKDEHRFVCDLCGMVAGSDPYEEEALEMARKVAKAQGWEWRHPGWGLRCPGCQS